MNLEAVEQRCLAYLKQVADPLVSVDRLLRHVQEGEDCESVTMDELLPFLRRHELFMVLDSPAEGAVAETADALRNLGFDPGPRVILSTRMPAQAELMRMMVQQIDTLIEAISKALCAAQEQGASAQAHQLMRLRNRAEGIKARLAEAINP